jgi:hypothetical protein
MVDAYWADHVPDRHWKDTVMKIGGLFYRIIAVKPQDNGDVILSLRAPYENIRHAEFNYTTKQFIGA